ncbi:MAG: peptidoglycan-binding protein [Pedococcus sp.]
MSIPVLTMPFVISSAQAAGVPKPPTRSLPSALDLASPYQAQRLCDPVAKPGVVAFATLLSSHYGLGTASYGIIRSCNSGVTEHSDGRAWDWMLSVNKPNEKAVADSVTAWLSAPDAEGRPGAMARRFGIMYIIWNRKMWRAYDPGRGWAPYTGSAPHTDHIHFSFSWDGAYGHTSWWTGRAITTIDPGPAATPAPAPAPASTGYPVLAKGAVGPDVSLAQKVVGATPDGQFGPRTEAAVRTWQGRNGVRVTGVMDAPTWAKMVSLKVVPVRGSTPAPPPAPAPTPAPTTPAPTTPAPTTPANPLAQYASTTISRGATGPAVVALQAALNVTADGQFGPKTEAAVTAFQTRRNLSATGVVGPPTWAALMGGTATTAMPSRSAPTRTTTAYTSLLSTVLRTGSRGEAVKALQRALGGLAVDGGYGPRTAGAVTAFQKAHHLPATGVTDATVWKALEARDYPLRGLYSTVLKQGSTGAAVVALQKALHIGADGEFGPQTQAAVKALQGRAKLARTGVVAAVTWKAIEAELRKR